ncbi:MAG: hypothetical protein ACREIA_23260 [Opitutaceae bacterium]
MVEVEERAIVGAFGSGCEALGEEVLERLGCGGVDENGQRDRFAAALDADGVSARRHVLDVVERGRGIRERNGECGANGLVVHATNRMSTPAGHERFAWQGCA